MCAQFMISASNKKLAEKYRISISKEGDVEGWIIKVLPFQKAPVILRKNDGGGGGVAIERKLEEMQFSLLPSWSKTHRVKFSTHNARLESFDDRANQKVFVYEKPTWREAFKKRHCLVPLSGFIEPIYTGELAGNMVRFFSPGEPLLTAAGIWEQWCGADGEIIDSFAILTDEPVPFVSQTGHDRSPVFLEEGSFDTWLNADGMTPRDSVEFLKEKAYKPELLVEVDRPLKAGWEKRKG